MTVLVVCLVLFLIAVTSLHQISLIVALLCIGIGAFAIYSKKIRAKHKLIAVVIAFVVILTLNMIEGFLENKREQEEAATAVQRGRKLAAEKAEREKQAQESFNRLTPAEHLTAAKNLLKRDAAQQSVEEGMHHLAAIKANSTEAAQARAIRQQFEAARKQYEAAEAKRRAAEEAARRDAELGSEITGITAQIRCRSAVEENLKAPSTADFQSTTDDYLHYEGKGVWHIQTKVDAENSFGAKLRSTFDCRVLCLSKEGCLVTRLNEL